MAVAKDTNEVLHPQQAPSFSFVVVMETTYWSRPAGVVQRCLEVDASAHRSVCGSWLHLKLSTRRWPPCHKPAPPHSTCPNPNKHAHHLPAAKCVCFCLCVYVSERLSAAGLSLWITGLPSCLNNLWDPSSNCAPSSTPPVTTSRKRQGVVVWDAANFPITCAVLPHEHFGVEARGVILEQDLQVFTFLPRSSESPQRIPLTSQV